MEVTTGWYLVLGALLFTIGNISLWLWFRTCAQTNK